VEFAFRDLFLLLFIAPLELILLLCLKKQILISGFL